MTSFKNIVGLTLTLSGLAMLPLMGCGGGAECGTGTVEEDGECVLDGTGGEGCEDGEVRQGDHCVSADALCGANTSYEEGECVADDALACGDDTELEPNSNTCISTADGNQCGAGTAVNEAGECLPTQDVCDDGTNFDAESRLCLSDVQCADSQTAVDGFCLDDAAYLASMADVEANANSNWELGGEHNVLPVDGMTVFTGTIDSPTDVNDDGDLDQHIDFFEFEAEAGDWFEVSVQSLGMPTAHFNIYSVFTEEVDGDDVSELVYWRSSTSFTGNDKMRQIVVPADGTYVIEVLPESLMNGNFRVIGGDDWNYVGTLESIDAPDATTHDFDANLEGSLGRLDDNFFYAEGYNAASTIALNWEETPANAEQVVQVWNSADDFVGEFTGSATFEVQESGDFYLVVDWINAYGSLGYDYEISAEELILFEDATTIEETITAQEGDILLVGHSNIAGSDVQVTVTADSDDSEIINEAVADERSARHIGLQAGDYTVTLLNDNNADLEEFRYDISLVTPTLIEDPQDVFSGTSHENDHLEQAYYLFETDATMERTLTLRKTSGIGYARIFIYELENQEVERMDSTINSNGTADTLDFEFQADTPYIIRIGEESVNSSVWPFDFEFTIADPSEFETETITDLADGDVLEIEQINDTDTVVMVTVTNDADEEIISEELSVDAMIRVVGVAAGDYTIAYSILGEAPEGFVATVTETSPTLIDDFTQVFSGTANEYIYGERDYYLVQVDTTITYDVTLEHVDGDGWLQTSIIDNNELLDISEEVYADNSTDTVSFEFEAGITYVIELGNTYESFYEDMTYELSFE